MSVPTLTDSGAEPLIATSHSPADRDPFELFSIGEMTTRVAGIAVEKAAHSLSFQVRSLVGGAMVSFGVLLALVVSTGVSSPGIASLLMGLAFGMSFALILVSGIADHRR
jgi:formate/nitrite transporter FocA (FNT family)